LRSGGNLSEWLKGWKQVFTIPRRVKKQPLDGNSMAYLREVQARLWF